MTEVVKEDSGVYFCEARNKIGFVARSFVKINFKGKLVLPLCLKKHTTLPIKICICKEIKTIFQLKTEQIWVTLPIYEITLHRSVKFRYFLFKSRCKS